MYTYTIRVVAVADKCYDIAHSLNHLQRYKFITGATEGGEEAGDRRMSVEVIHLKEEFLGTVCLITCPPINVISRFLLYPLSLPVSPPSHLYNSILALLAR